MAHGDNRSTAKDMLMSLAVILIPLLVIVWVFTRTPDEPEVDPVNWKPVVAQARADAGYPVLAPAEVPTDWKPVKARYVDRGGQWVGSTQAAGNRWELGFRSGEDVYIAINQSDEPGRDSYIDSVTRSSHADGRSTVGGQSWQRRVSGDGRTRSLVRTIGGSTAVVVADTGYQALESFAQTLRTS